MMPRVRTAVLALLPAALVLAGCAAPPSDAGVTVDELLASRYFYQGDHRGAAVTVLARVADVAGPTVLDLAGEGGTLTVVSVAPVEVTPGQPVRVTGTVGQTHTSFPSDGVPYIQTDLYAKDSTRSYLYDATVQPVGG